MGVDGGNEGCQTDQQFFHIVLEMGESVSVSSDDIKLRQYNALSMNEP